MVNCTKDKNGWPSFFLNLNLNGKDERWKRWKRWKKTKEREGGGSGSGVWGRRGPHSLQSQTLTSSSSFAFSHPLKMVDSSAEVRRYAPPPQRYRQLCSVKAESLLLDPTNWGACWIFVRDWDELNLSMNICVIVECVFED